MKKYKVLVEGANFLITFDDETSKHGFFTTRFVEARTEEEAESETIEMLRVELEEVVKNDQADSPVMFIDEIVELDSFGDFPVPGTGFVWFPDEKGH